MVETKERSKVHLCSSRDIDSAILDVTYDISNWEEWEIAIERDELSATYKTTSFPLQFVRNAKTYLIDRFNEGLWNTSLFVAVQIRNMNPKININGFTEYAQPEYFELDFTSYVQHDDYIELSTKERDLRTIIKENSATKYDFDVLLLRDSNKWVFDRLTTENSLWFKQQNIANRQSELFPISPAESAVSFTLGVSLNGDTDVHAKDYFLYQDIPGFTKYEAGTDNYKRQVSENWFLRCIKAAKCHVSITSVVNVFCATLTVNSASADALQGILNDGLPLCRLSVQLRKVNLPALLGDTVPSALSLENYAYTIPLRWLREDTLSDYSYLPQVLGAPISGQTTFYLVPDFRDPFLPIMGSGKSAHIDGNTWLDRDINMAEGDILLMEGDIYYNDYFVAAALQPYVTGMDLSACMVNNIEVKYEAKLEPVTLDVINPQTLGQELVNTITNTVGHYQLDIEWLREDDSSSDPDEYRPNVVRIIPAESLRRLNFPKIHTSWSDFAAWMKALSYLPVMEGNKIIFKPVASGSVYQDDEDSDTLTLTEEDTADLKIYPDVKQLYSSVKCGYKKVELSTTNGRLEFNGESQYVTSAVSANKVLDIVSPYRADSLGIEYLVPTSIWGKRDEKEDKDVWFAGLIYDKVKGVYNNVPDNFSPSEQKERGMFNGRFAPPLLLKRYGSVLSGITNTLIFASGTNNTDFPCIYNPETSSYSPANSDIFIKDKPLFSPVILDVATGVKVLDLYVRNPGIIEFPYRGKTFRGQVSDIRRNPLWNKEVQWKMLQVRGDLNPSRFMMPSVGAIRFNQYPDSAKFTLHVSGHTPEECDIVCISGYPAWLTEDSVTRDGTSTEVAVHIIQNTNISSSREFTLTYGLLNDPSVTCEILITQRAAYSNLGIEPNVIPEGMEFACNTEVQNVTQTVVYKDNKGQLQFFSDVQNVNNARGLLIFGRMGYTSPFMFGDGSKDVILLMASSIQTEPLGDTSRMQHFFLGRPDATDKGRYEPTGFAKTNLLSTIGGDSSWAMFNNIFLAGT